MAWVMSRELGCRASPDPKQASRGSARRTAELPLPVFQIADAQNIFKGQGLEIEAV